MPGLYDNIVRVVTSTAAAINAEIATQNAANYWLHNMAFDQAGLAVLIFSKFDNVAFSNPAPQKVNEVNIVQVTIDADIATEDANDFLPTGVFIDGNNATKLWILYQQVVESGS